MRLLIITLIVLIAHPIISVASIPALSVDENLEYVKLGSWLRYYTDHDKAYTIADIKDITEDTWQAFPSENASVKGAAGYQWIRCDIENKSESDVNLNLSIEYAHIAEYQLYIVSDDEVKTYNVQGDNFRFSEREIKEPYFVHEILFIPQSRYSLIIRFNQEGQDLPLPIALRSASDLIQKNINRHIFHGLALGIILVISIFVFILYYFTKINFLLIESMVVLLSILYVLSEEGYGFMYIWGDIWPRFNGYSRPASIGTISILYLCISLSFLDIKSKNLRQYKTTIRWAIIYSISLILFHPIFLIPVQNENNIISFIFFFLTFTAFINSYNCYLAAYSYIKYKNKDALVLLMVYAIIPIVISARSLLLISDIPTNFIAQHGGILVLTLHGIIIGGFMIYKSLQSFNENQATILSLSEDKRIAATSMLQDLNNERERISMDIHDSLGSLLSGVSLNLQSLKENYRELSQESTLENTIEYVHNLDEEMRNISHNLLPKTLKEFGLIHAINKLIENENESSLKFNFEFQGFDNRLPESIELELYRMILEIIDNIKKHANAKNVLLQINNYKNEVNLIVEDDGIGYRPSKVRKGASGLRNLRNRIKLLNGEIDINTRVGEGTSIGMNIPISENDLEV